MAGAALDMMTEPAMAQGCRNAGNRVRFLNVFERACLPSGAGSHKYIPVLSTDDSDRIDIRLFADDFVDDMLDC